MRTTWHKHRGILEFHDRMPIYVIQKRAPIQRFDARFFVDISNIDFNHIERVLRIAAYVGRSWSANVRRRNGSPKLLYP